MNFQDTSWIDDPAVVIGEISTGGNYALSVNGAFNALSLNQDGKDINDIFLKLNDFNPNSLCNLYVSNLITTGTINTSNITPSLYYIFLCWCAYTKYWFKMDSNIEFHIIDENGEERILTLKDSIVIKNNKAYGENTPSNDEQKKNE